MWYTVTPRGCALNEITASGPGSWVIVRPQGPYEWPRANMPKGGFGSSVNPAGASGSACTSAKVSSADRRCCWCGLVVTGAAVVERDWWPQPASASPVNSTASAAPDGGDRRLNAGRLLTTGWTANAAVCGVRVPSVNPTPKTL